MKDSDSIIERLDFFSDKALQLKADNETLSQENVRLQGEVERLGAELEALKSSSARYIAERDDIKERVERLIDLIG